MRIILLWGMLLNASLNVLSTFTVCDHRVHFDVLLSRVPHRRYNSQASLYSSIQRYGDDATIQGLAKVVAIR